MKIEFGVRVDEITEESLLEALTTMFIYDDNESPIDDLWFYVELLSVLSKDLDYLRDMKREMVCDIIGGEVENFNEDDFAPLCGDGDITNHYAKKHFSEFSKKAQDRYLELEAQEKDGEYDFLIGVDYHISIYYVGIDDTF